MFFDFSSWLRALGAAITSKRLRPHRLPFRRNATVASTQSFYQPNLELLELRLAPAIVTPFAVRYSINTTGDTVILGNTLETASVTGNTGRTATDVSNAQNGTGSFINNNDWNTVYVDMDGNSSTFNSSQASLNLPNGSSVLFAGLYWMGSSTSTLRNKVMIDTPAAGGYTTLTGAIIGDTATTTIRSDTGGLAAAAPNYEGFANVTSLVQAGGNGAYTVANVQATTGTNFYAGWAMVVAYRAPSLPARNITIFDGYGVIQSGDPALNIPISGFIAPPAGTVNAKVSVVSAEGDLGLTGDSMKMNGTILSNSLNPSTNFFNSSITNAGSPFTAKSPNYVNQLGFDADSVQVPAGVIANNATSATVTLTTSGDTYFPGVVATTIDLYAPKLDATKTVTDLSGNPNANLPGDTLEYVVSVTNNGQDPGGNIILNDPIPANTTYVPGSLRIVSGANAGTKTDAAGDDQARFDSVNNQVIFNLGTGATATLGGSLAIGATTSIRFDVKVNNSVAANTVITNQASLNYTGVTTGFAFSSLSTVPGLTITNSLADIAVTKSVSPTSTPNVGDPINFTVTATNNGPGPASGVNVVDLLPSGLQLTNATTTQGVYTGANGLWTIGSLANGASATLTIFATVTGSTTQTNTATVSHTDSIDLISSNNQASATVTPMRADLSVTKTVDTARPNVGDTVNFLITVAGRGPDPATHVELTDLLPAGLFYLTSTPSTGSYDKTTGLWIVGTIANGGSATLQISARVIGVGAQLNTATITHSDVFDPNTANNMASTTVTPQQADLKISKTVNNASPNVGDNITFVVTLTNLGPDFATGVTVQDLLPVGLTYVSSTPSQGTYNPISGQWTVGVVDPLSPRTLALVATVVSSAPLTNRASVSGVNQFDPDTTHNSDSVTETPQQADLVVTKTVNNAAPNVGNTITFTVTVKNNGPNSATNVNVNDLLPTGLAYISNTASQGNYFNTTGTWTVGILGNGATATLTLTAKVASELAQTNTATATADQFDPNLANNSKSVTETPQQADLKITKGVDDLFPNIGSNVTFTITLTNNGPNAATNVTVQEFLPAGLVFVSFIATQGTYNSATGLWTVGTIGVGASPNLSIVATATTRDSVTNSASISHSDQFDPNPGNNSDFINVRGADADLAVTKTVDKATASVGDAVNFTITVSNLNGSAARDVQVTDKLPAGLQFVSASTSDGTYSNATGIWALANTLRQRDTSTLTISAIMRSTTAQTNTATVTNSSRPDPNQANNSGSATVNPATADLVVSKSVDNPNPNIGAKITYTIRVTDSGPDTATNVTVQDNLPGGVSFVSFSASQGSYSEVTGQWSVGTINVGTPQILTIVATVTRLLPGPNTASISHSDQFDPVTANNSDSASIIPLTADLAITKTVSNARPNLGETVAFTVTLTNDGPANASNVSVTDLLPAGLTFVSASPTQGTYAAATGLWTVGTLTSSNAVILTLQAMVASSAALTNTATIKHSDQFDPNTANNSDTATVTPQLADLEVFKFVDNATPNVGDTVNFTIDIENIGPSAATNVLLNDLLPAGLVFVSSLPSQGSYNPSTGVWNVGTMPDGIIATLTVSAQVVNSGAHVNTAAIGHSDQPDPNTANNQASATVTTLEADLKITKTVSNTRPNVGDTIAFTVTLTNLGPGLATNVQVADLLPTGLTLVSFVPSQGTYDPVTGLWAIPTVTTALARTLILNARVDVSDPKTNTATITDSDVFDPNNGNNTASATETPLQADLGLTKTVSNAHPNVGDTITYIVTLSNAGVDGATHVQVIDLLPAGLGFVSATPSQGAYGNVTGVWNVGTVAAHAGATLQIQAKVISFSQQLNTATISEVDQFDPNTANNSASALETPKQADLSVRKSVSNPTPNVGDTLTYTVRVTNSGPDAATNVLLSDVLPAGVSYQSSSATSGTYNPTTRIWSIATVANGVTETLTILANVVNINPQANTANITHADQFDPNQGNNFDTASINPQVADLQIAKSVDNPTPNVNGTINFTVTLTNDGPATATNVKVTDLLPAGLFYLSSTPSPGTTYDSGSGVWTVGTVTMSTPLTLTIQARVDSTTPLTNTAAITAADQFDPDPDNNQASATETPQIADLVIAKAVSDHTPNVGDKITFVVAVADRGPNAASNVTVMDKLPAGLTLVTFTPSRGTYTPSTGVWDIGTVDPSAAQTLTLTATVVSALSATNTATITHSDQHDPDTTNNTASATETPQQADLIVAKTVSNANPNVDDVITYTVTVTDLGPDQATGVQLTDRLPTGLALVSDTESQGVYNSATGVWIIGQVDTTAPATLTLQARVVSSAPTNNIATITHSDQFDPTPGNNTANAIETPQRADLSLTKTVSNTTPDVGEAITFTIMLTNLGPNVATAVTVRDALPAGLMFAGATASQGTYLDDSGVWVVGTVALGPPLTLQIQATVDVPDAHTNTASISHSAQFDPNTGNNTASATETPRHADLALTKTVSNAKPNVNDTITFTITVTDKGPDAASNVEVTDLLPAGLNFVSATPGANYDSSTGVWIVGTVAMGAPQTLQIQATVASPAARTNTATITKSAQFDPDTGNNSAAATETPQQADLQLSKTVNNLAPNVNDFIIYTITLTNNGPDPATTVTVQDTLPLGVTFDSFTASQGSYDKILGVWTVGTVNPGTPQALAIRAQVKSTSLPDNFASVSHADQHDPVPGNNSDSASVTPQQADLSINKTVSNATPNVGTNVTFTVTLTNSGPSSATNVKVTDLLPTGLTYVTSTPSQGTYVASTGLWTVGTVANGGHPTLTLTARVDSPNALTNTATVSGADQVDSNPGNNSGSATETPQQADLHLTKSVSDTTPNLNDPVTFTVTVANQGPNAATGVTIKDLLPAGLAFDSATASQGTYDKTTGSWIVGTVALAASQSLVIHAHVVSSAPQTNSAEITHSDQFDPDTTDNGASATVTPRLADLAVLKIVSNAKPNVYDNITFTILVVNNGPDAATGVTINDLLPLGLSFVSSFTAKGSYDHTTGVWTLGTLQSQGADALFISAKVVNAAAQTNTASILHSDQADPVTTNNSASVTETPQQADLSLTKIVSNATPNVGDIITFKVTLSNNGPNTATNVAVTDLLPAGLTFVSAAPSQGIYDSISGVWEVGKVTAPTILTIQARVGSPSARTNTATIGQADQFDPVTTNNSASVTETPQQADLALTKSVNVANPNVGIAVTFTVTLTNNGPNSATNVQVTDLLPVGLKYVSAVPSQGTYDSATGIWTVGTVTTTVPQTLLLKAQVLSSDPRTNTATISHADQYDAVSSNNSASATETPLRADLALAKTVDNPTPNVGDLITFTVTLTNKGPDQATGVVAQDFLPAGLLFVSANQSQGTYVPSTGFWNVGNVSTSVSPKLTLRARVNRPSPRINTAEIELSDQFDPDTSNNSASVLETPQKADLAISKTVSDATPNVGNTITFTVTLTNNGPDAATNVQVTDLLPAGLTFVSATPSADYDSTTGIWMAGTVTSGTPKSLQIQASVSSPSARTNSATITHADQFDPDITNNGASATETPQQADLRVTKTVSNATPNVFDTITFTVTVSNLGPDEANNVRLTDLLPAGLGFVLATPSQGSYDNVTGLWDIGTVAAVPQTLEIQARVTSASARTNTATLIHADQYDPVTTNNSASVTETPQLADLALTKTVSNARPNVGNNITFTITLTDKGPNTATNVEVTDLLPVGLTFVSATASQGDYVSATGIWTVGTVTTTTPQTLLIQATVTLPTALTNTATISDADQFDLVKTNNSASVTETPQRSDLGLSKSVSNSTPNVGDTITFTITLTNHGPDSATNAQVTDALPTGLLFVSATPSQGSYVAGSGLWTVGTVTTATPQTLQIRAKVLSPDPVTNTATISDSDQYDGNSGNDISSVTETPQQADLALTKTVSNATPNVGDTITFTVTLTNSGVNTATNVQVTDVLPTGLTFVSATPSQAYVAATGIWSAGTVTTATPQTLQIRARVTSSVAQTNAANISHSDQFDPDTTNNSASATETPQQADLALSKTVSNATPNVNDTITFTVTLTNNGPDAASGVQVTDLLPAGLMFVSANPSGSYDRTTGVWTVGPMPAMTSQTLQIQAKVTSAGAKTNTATVSHADQFDLNNGNNTASATETPQQADLQVTKTVDKLTPNVGETVTYTITVTNNGPDIATGVTVFDMLPAQVRFQGFRGAFGSYDQISHIWTVGTIAVGASETILLDTLVISASPQANTASVQHSDQFDPNTANNSDTASINPQQADLSLSKIVSNAKPNVNDFITFTVTLTNNGPAPATSVSVNDLLPVGLTFAGVTPSQGTYVSSTGVWTVGNLANGAHVTLQLHAHVVSASAQTNTATIRHADQFDPDTGNNSASATETPQRADLSLTKLINKPRPNVGETVVFIVALRNIGPDSATGVVVNDSLPAGLSLVSAFPSPGTTYTGGVWNVGTVTPSAARILIITATVVSPNPQTNTATIGHSDQFDPVTTNNSASVTETPRRADLAIAKSVTPTAPNVGDPVSYLITLTNKGPDAATGIRVTDNLPAGLSLVSAVPSQGSYDPVTGIWSITSLANAGVATLTLNAVVTVPTALTNTATITDADQYDPVTTNNNAGATATPQRADLALTKTVSNPKPNVGDTITFTIRVSNSGPNSATNVSVSDILPAGLTFVSATPSQGAYNSATGFWTVGTVTTTIAQTLQLRARVASPQTRTNTATIVSADQYDPNTGNNSQSATETPQLADLAVSKTVNGPAPNVGDTIYYTITVANSGPDSATNVTILDKLPAGLTFVFASPSLGTYNSATGIWTVGTVTSTTPQTLLLFARVASALPATNSAVVNHADQFDPNRDNNQASVTEIPQQADLFLAKTVDNANPLVGDTITFTVTLTNLGPNEATSVVVNDRLPAGLQFVSANPSQGSYDPSTGVWMVGTLAPEIPQTLTLLAKVTVPQAVRNTATVKFADQFDPDLTNNTASIGALPQVPRTDLALSKTASQTQVAVGMNVTYTFIVRNLGPDTATGVTVTDPFPPGLVFVSAAMPSQGTYNPVTGVWSVGTMLYGVVATLKVTARVTLAIPIINRAVAGAVEIDPALMNNVSSVFVIGMNPTFVIGMNPTTVVSKRNFLAR